MRSLVDARLLFNAYEKEVDALSLTVKQEIFVQRLIEGDSQRSAYRFAYNAENMKDETVDNKASLLFSKGEIRKRYDELKQELKERSFYTVEKANADLEWIKNKAREDIEYKGLKQANSNAYIGAVKQQIDLNGLDKVDINKDDSIKIKIVKASEKNG